MSYIIHYDVAGIIILAAVMLHFYYKKTINTRRTRIFSHMIALALTSNLLDLLTIYTIDHSAWVPLWLNYLLNQAYLICFNILPTIYLIYIVVAVEPKKPLVVWQWVSIFTPVAVAVLIILSTPWTGAVFYFDENRYYCHGGVIKFLYAIALFYVCTSLVCALVYRRRLTLLQKASVWFFTVSSLVAILVQMLFPKLMVIQFIIAVVLLLIYLSMENPEDYEDKTLGMYNSAALSEFLSAEFRFEQPFTVLGIRVVGTRYISEILGSHAKGELLKELAEFLRREQKEAQAFYLSGNQFAVVEKGREAHCLDELAQKVRERFRQPFFFNGAQVSLDAPMCLFSYPNHVGSLEDVTGMLVHALRRAKQQGNEAILQPEQGELTGVRREQEILQIMRKALREGGFQVHYQPIFSVEEGRFICAEALVRLECQGLGFVSPEEFIPLAERNGLIFELGELVFRMVCRFMAKERLWEQGIRSIDVNLSSIQCVQTSLAERLMAIMDEYGLDYRHIELEVTESAAVLSSEALKSNLQKLAGHGVRISLDDYGTGYSNAVHIIQYPFHTVKLDKSMVWSAMEDQKAMCMLKHIIAMVKEMDMDIIAEGVETKGQAEVLAALGCDFFQGYYYARPMPSEAFLKRLQTEQSMGKVVDKP